MSESALTPVILCGGTGTRLWPLSNRRTPKQFLDLDGDRSMLAMTADRVSRSDVPDLTFENLLAIGSARHEKLLREQLPEARLILEPFGRNSAAAVAAAALVSSFDDLLLVLPADHHIAFPHRFHAAIKAGIDQAKAGSIVTFGIKPTFPSTGYGYIELKDESGPVQLANAFVEKPDEETARAYIETGRYVWNAGIFLFKAGVMVDAFRSHAPDILASVRASLPADASALSQGETVMLDPVRFQDCPSISVDYAIMERFSPIYGVPVDMGWNDVGDYKALWDLSDRDEAGNVHLGKGAVIDSRDTYVRSEHLPVYVSGVEDLIIVANDRYIMVSPLSQAQDVKALAGLAATPPPERRALSDAARKVLEQQFATWLKSAWDTENGGFHESLKRCGSPAVDMPRRTRVAARQIFSFAMGLELGLCDADAARELIDCGLQLLEELRSPGGGWVHLYNPDGSTRDASENLYDNAFIMLAGATVFKVLGDGRGLAMAEAALSNIEATKADPVHGGYFEGVSKTDERMANSHMHLLEAFLALHAATRDESYLKRASDMASLFESHFFDPRTDTVREFFTADWKFAPGARGEEFQPGHHYEWATLLLELEQRSDRDSVSWRRRLIAKADRDGSEAGGVLCMNAALANGEPLDTNMRLWPQLEKLRAKFAHGASSDEVHALLVEIEAVYLKPAGQGLMIDEVDASRKPLDKPVPASMLYHMVTALGPLILAD